MKIREIQQKSLRKVDRLTGSDLLKVNLADCSTLIFYEDYSMPPLIGLGLPASRPLLYNMVATTHVWLVKFDVAKISLNKM